MAFIDKRKRSREDDTYYDTSMPLSKRINNLHLTNFDETHPHCSSIPLEISQYNPELTEAQNPYFWKNKLLHDLHMERLKRCTV